MIVRVKIHKTVDVHVPERYLRCGRNERASQAIDHVTTMSVAEIERLGEVVVSHTDDAEAFEAEDLIV